MKIKIKSKNSHHQRAVSSPVAWMCLLIFFYVLLFVELYLFSLLSYVYAIYFGGFLFFFVFQGIFPSSYIHLKHAHIKNKG